jgi:hypothetical protein
MTRLLIDRTRRVRGTTSTTTGDLERVTRTRFEQDLFDTLAGPKAAVKSSLLHARPALTMQNGGWIRRCHRRIIASGYLRNWKETEA